MRRLLFTFFFLISALAFAAPYNAGFVAVNTTVRIPWNTNAASGASITRSVNGTVKVYKDGSATPRSSANGITDSEDFNSFAGMHLTQIDLSDNTDAGFYAAGSSYVVAWTAMTIDSQTVNAFIGGFTIGPPPANVTQWNGTAPNNLQSGRVDSYTGAMASGVVDATAIATDAIGAAELATDAIGAAELAQDSIGAPEIQTDAITAAEISVNAIGASELADGAIDAGAFASGAIDAAAIASGAIVKGTEATGWNDLDAAGIRSAVGLASANLDTQLDALPTAAEIRVEMDSNSTKLANLDAAISTRAAAATALSTVQWTNGRAAALDNLDAAISTRLATADYTAPDNSSIAAILADTNLLDTSGELRTLLFGSDTPGAIQSSVDDLEGRLTSTRAGYLDYLDRFNGMIELDGLVYRYTANALELAPSVSAATIAEDVWEFLISGKQAQTTLREIWLKGNR